MRFKTILACTDFSETGNRAIEAAFELAGSGAKVLVTHIVDLPHVPNPMYAHYFAEAAFRPDDVNRAIDEAKRAMQEMIPGDAKERGLDVSLEAPTGQPVTELLRLAEERKVDMMIVGTHSRQGLQHLLLGSVAERVVRSFRNGAVLVVH